MSRRQRDWALFAPTRVSQGCRQFAVVTIAGAVLVALAVAAWSLGLR